MRDPIPYSPASWGLTFFAPIVLEKYNKIEFSIFSFPSNFCERIESTAMANPFLYSAPTFDHYPSEEPEVPWQGPWFPSSEMFLPETEFFPVIEQPLEYYNELAQVFSVPSVDAYAMGQPSEPYTGSLYNSKYITKSRPFVHLISTLQVLLMIQTTVPLMTGTVMH